MVKKLQFKYCWLLIIALLLAACDSGPASQGLGFENAWIRAIPPGVKMTAGFGALQNRGSAALQIESFSSPSFGDVSLHRTEIVEGVSKMREVPALSIDAGASVVLEPGGYHLMLMMPVGDIQPGQVVTVTITASDGRSFSFDLPVERR